MNNLIGKIPISRLKPGSAANQLLTTNANGDGVSWSAVTFPATTTINQLLYSSPANTITGLATANSGLLVTSGAGVPSIGTDIPTAVTIGGQYVYRVLGTDISLADGGTAASLTASTGGIVYSGATAMAILAGTATANQALLSGSSAAPTWSTATYPATTTINQILYSSAANTIAGLATANNSILATGATGIPSLATDIPTAVTIGGAYVYRVGGTDVALADGGTNASLVASNGGIFYSTATAGAILAGTATAGQILRSGLSAAPSWSTATYPATATGAGTILRADGTNFLASTLTIPDTAAINTILYASAANVISSLATGNNGILATGATGVPAIGTDIPTAVTIGSAYIYRVGGTDIALADGGTNASLVASNGGVFYSTATAGAILAGTATAGQVLRSGASAAPAWSTPTFPNVATAGTVIRGDGTNLVLSTLTIPDTAAISTILYASAANVISALATGNSGLLVTSGTGVPSIATDIPTAVTIGGQYVYRVGGTDIAIADGGTGVGSWTNGQLLVGNTTGNTAALATLTGTVNQITVTNGASSITLAAPQDLATASNTQFAKLGLGVAADATNVLTATSASTTDLSKAVNVTHTGAITGTGYGGYFSKTGVSTTNVGLYATASGGTNNYAAIFEAGSVGIGTTGPGGRLEIKSSGGSTWIEKYTNSAGTHIGGFYETGTNHGQWHLANSTGTDKVVISANSGQATYFNHGGNVGIGTTVGFGTNAAGVLSVGAGTAPTTSPADVTQAWTADWNGAGTNALFLRTEEGTQHVFGSNFGIGHITPDRLLHPELADAITAAVSYAQRLSHVVSTASTGSSDGFGVGLEFELETGTDLTNQISGTIESLWATAANATRKGRMNLYAYDTAARLGLTVEASGTAAMLGFYGVPAVVRPTALTAQLTTLTFTEPGTPDYAIQSVTQTTPFGFVTADEGNSVLKALANIQTRMSEVETKMQALGLLT